eukprot:4172721-Pleurochrysis_carterae.AAC.1
MVHQWLLSPNHFCVAPAGATHTACAQSGQTPPNAKTPPKYYIALFTTATFCLAVPLTMRVDVEPAQTSQGDSRIGPKPEQEECLASRSEREGSDRRHGKAGQGGRVLGCWLLKGNEKDREVGAAGLHEYVKGNQIWISSCIDRKRIGMPQFRVPIRILERYGSFHNRRLQMQTPKVELGQGRVAHVCSRE